ncbi:MAG: hypothetical protein J7K84_04445 [Deltaproteobacteria bacterium]|nr:hypothetical protein [Deltaproteobacteria bacterium]
MEADKDRSVYKKEAYLFLDKILKHDGYTIVSGFSCSDFLSSLSCSALSCITNIIDFIAYNDDNRIILFFFYNENREKILKKISATLHAADKNLFQISYYIIFPASDQMDQFRTVEWAENWQRGFFLSFDEIKEKASQIDQTGSGEFITEIQKTNNASPLKQSIKHLTAKIISNSPVGDKKDPEHYILKFKATGLNRIVPGQFVMVDTLTVGKRKILEENYYNNYLTPLNPYSIHSANKNFKRKSFLKRPFGIHRAYYKFFKLNYLKHLSLPPHLAAITHTVFPHEFKILYKLIDDGTGTNELKKIREGDNLRMLGPLGNAENPVLWRLKGIEEIHLVGGGVGMAPLIFFGQALKFYSYKIKAFIGIDTIATLIKSAPFARTFADTTDNAFVYIDELSKIGFKSSEIFLSSEIKIDNNLTIDKIAEKNIHHGFVTEQYKSYLSGCTTHKKIMIITCGPKPMLMALKKNVDKFNIPMKVLLEKRMGCGIGVCMSCVCKTIKNNREKYSRVCMEGPMFDAGEICWEKL